MEYRIGGIDLNEQNKVVKFKKRKSINIGIIVFFVLVIYVVINVYIYLTKEQLTIYEVKEGSAAVNARITGLILRQEKLVNSNSEGYLIYYQKNGARIAKNEPVYSITANEIYNTSKSDDAIVLTDKNENVINHEVKDFQNTFSTDNYSVVYRFKENTQNSVQDILNSSLISDVKDAGLSEGTVKSGESGIITYSRDDFENVNLNNISTDMFNIEKYKKTNLRTTDKITRNTPVYKMITSDNWELILPLTTLTKEQYKMLADKNKKSITFTVVEDDSQITASLKLMSNGSDRYAILSMNKKMAHYMDERYLTVEINFNSEPGLKIPNTAIVKKALYQVPKEYFTKGGESKGDGLIVEKDGDEVTYPFVATDIYYEDSKYWYIDKKLFKPGTRVKLPKKSDFYVLSKTKTFNGVYNVNQGYAVFKRVNVLSKNDEYSIVSDNMENGLSAYDHIVLDGKIAVEQKIIY